MRLKPSLIVATVKLACGFLIAVGPPVSAENLHPGIIGADDRVPVLQHGSPWDAIGQVNVGGFRMSRGCTGTLVAPDIVVTAAHCVMDQWHKAPFPLHDIHFLAAVQGSESKGHSTAKCLHVLKNYVFAPPEKNPDQQLRSLTTDVVAIVLNDKLIIEPAPLADTVIAQPGLPLVHAAYPADRRFVLTAHFDCHLLGVQPLWLNDCDTHPASSGGPLFVEIDGTFRLAAVMLGGNGSFNAALPISQWKHLIDEKGCP